jgi:succinyl-diaminopimelate desuccinylase
MPITQHTLETLKTLIAFRSTEKNSEALWQCADFLAEYFQGSSYEVKRFEKNNIPSLTVLRKNQPTPKVLLCGHFDVVDGRDEQFSVVEKAGRIYGRGALDMKSGVAVLLQIMQELESSEKSVGLLLTGDEESGGFAGTGYVLSQGLSCEVAVIPDGGMRVSDIVLKEKGILRFTLTAHGVAAHGSRPWEGRNAILKLMEVLDSLNNKFKTSNGQNWLPTFNVGKIEGGLVTNQVPEEARAYCDVRFTEADNVDKLVKEMRSLLPPEVEMQVIFQEPMTNTPEDNPFVVSFAASVKSIGRTPEFFSAHGSSDGRWFSKLGIPVIISQPDGGGHHTSSEWVSLQGMEDYLKVLQDFI